ncbi:MAG: DciA family protein [Planctomycetota bacterium]
MMKPFRGNETEVKKLGDVLSNSVLSVKRAGKRNKNLREKWKNVAGEVISGHTEVGVVRKGVLYIDVDSATWLHHISSFKKEELLASIQNEFKRGYISDIKFRVGNF